MPNKYSYSFIFDIGFIKAYAMNRQLQMHILSLPMYLKIGVNCNPCFQNSYFRLWYFVTKGWFFKFRHSRISPIFLKGTYIDFSKVGLPHATKYGSTNNYVKLRLFRFNATNETNQGKTFQNYGYSCLWTKILVSGAFL